MELVILQYHNTLCCWWHSIVIVKYFQSFAHFYGKDFFSSAYENRLNQKDVIVLHVVKIELAYS